MLKKSPLDLPEALSGHEARGLIEGEPIAQFQLGDQRNFVYLILDWTDRKAALVDLQDDFSIPLQGLRNHGFQLERVLLTHTHFDHVAGVEEFVEENPGIPLHLHALDRHRFKEKSAEVQKACQELQDGAVFSVGQLSVEALHTPGHSVGELCYRVTASGAKSGTRSYLFTGDTLFIRDCGRTDLPTGSNSELFESLQRLKQLDPATLILPGHHYVQECASILAHELETSPPLQCRSVRELEALP